MPNTPAPQPTQKPKQAPAHLPVPARRSKAQRAKGGPETGTVLARDERGRITAKSKAPIDWDVADVILDMIAGGTLLQDVCEQVGIGRGTVLSWRLKDKEFARQYQVAEEAAMEHLDEDMSVLLAKIKEGKQIDSGMLFYFDRVFKLYTFRMERLHRRRYGAQLKVEHVLPENCGDALVKALTDIVVKYQVKQEDIEVAVTLFLKIVQPVAA